MTQGGTGQGQSRRGTVWGVLGGILGIGLIAFIVQNTESVSFDWLFWTFSAPLWLMLLVTSLVAFVIGQFALMWRRHRRRQARRDAR